MPSLAAWSNVPVNQALQNVASHWPSTTTDGALSERTVAEIDPKDAHVMLAAREHAVDVLVTSNKEDFAILKPICSVEAPSTFLQRWATAGV